MQAGTPTPREPIVFAAVLAAGSSRRFGRHKLLEKVDAEALNFMAREARGLTWYALAKLAGIPNQGTIRDIEQGKDVRLSNLQAVASALDLQLELVEHVA